MVLFPLLLGACSLRTGDESSNEGIQTAAPGPAEDSSQAVGIVALGHSGLTGEGSDPSRPGQEAKELSWATGTAQEVNSILQRLTAVHPETGDQVANMARGGAQVTSLLPQAQAGLKIVPHPELVIIQTIDNDIQCDGNDLNRIEAFGAALSEALQFITGASPNSKILVVSQQGRPATFAEAMSVGPAIWQNFAGTGVCDLFNNDGTINQDHIAGLTAIIESFEAEQTRVCAAVPQCSTDDGVLSGYVDDISDWVVGDWNHLNVSGQARRAELVWPIVKELLGLK